MPPPTDSRPARRTLIAAVAAVLLAGLATLAWIAGASEPEQGALQPSPPPATRPAVEDELAAQLERPGSAPAEAHAGNELELRESVEAESRPAAGFGVLVHALAPDGSPWPGPWTLFIEDEREGVVPGWRPRAEPGLEARELPNGLDPVGVEGLKPGKWAFHAAAANEVGEHRSARVRARFEGGAATSFPARVYELELVLHAASAVEGRVLGSEGQPLEGVVLALDHAPDASRHWAQTDAQGWYAFTLAAHGEYRLSVGHPDHPSRPAQLVNFAGAPLVLEPIALADTAELRVRVLEADGTPAAGVALRSKGSAGGWLEGETDAQGSFHARHLPAGRYRVHAEHGPRRRANREIELAAGASAELEIQLP